MVLVADEIFFEKRKRLPKLRAAASVLLLIGERASQLASENRLRRLTVL